MKRILTAAALAAALLSSAPRAAAACPYKVGPLGRYIAPAVVQGMTATDDGNAVEVWCTDALDGDDWFFTVDNETDLRIFDRVQLVVDAAGTPDDFSDDRVIDALSTLGHSPTFSVEQPPCQRPAVSDDCSGLAPSPPPRRSRN